ncbi:MAG: peptidylprolyl isomerase, partial [Vicinamibacterales bacterium]
MRALLVAGLCTASLWSASPSSERVSSALAARQEPGAVRAEPAPQLFRVRLQTTKGPIVVEVHRDWAPRGADRFFELVTDRYFDDNRFFRVVKGQWAQFGINGDPALARRWRTRTIPDDPRGQSNIRGMVAFAFAEPNARTTQVYIALKDLSDPQDAQGFVPFGRVVAWMIVEKPVRSVGA